MPQMAPISWFLLFIVFSGTLLIFNCLNYYSYLSPNPQTSHSSTLTQNPLPWKW
uniref:ATP synthase complex subunit 8 n=1 Tax=Neoperla conradti TaxID=3065838 RepID=A0AA95Z7I2_9NEOP|nr:ATPase subunit 8 [Neoperla conradti]